MSENIVPVPDNVNIVQNENDTPINQAGSGMAKIFRIDESFGLAVPEALKTLMSTLVNPSASDLTVLVLYILTVETGFAPEHYRIENDESHHFNIRRLKSLTEMPSGWKDKNGNGTYKITFILPSLPEAKCELFCFSHNSDFMSVIMFFCDTSGVLETHSIIVRPSEFVDHYGNLIINNLKNLSLKYKNCVSLPVRTEVLSKYGYRDGFLALPQVIMYKIFDYLDEINFITLTSVCKYMYDSFSKDCVVWTNLKNREIEELKYMTSWELSQVYTFNLRGDPVRHH